MATTDKTKWCDDLKWVSLTALPVDLTNLGDTVHTKVTENKDHMKELAGYTFIMMAEAKIGDYVCYYDGYNIGTPTRITGMATLAAATPIPGGTVSLPAGIAALMVDTKAVCIYTPNDEGIEEAGQWQDLTCVATEMRQATYAAYMFLFLRPHVKAT